LTCGLNGGEGEGDVPLEVFVLLLLVSAVRVLVMSLLTMVDMTSTGMISSTSWLLTVAASTSTQHHAACVWIRRIIPCTTGCVLY
jgi:hypothetical protein